MGKEVEAGHEHVELEGELKGETARAEIENKSERTRSAVVFT